MEYSATDNNIEVEKTGYILHVTRLWFKLRLSEMFSFNPWSFHIPYELCLVKLKFIVNMASLVVVSITVLTKITHNELIS